MAAVAAVSTLSEAAFEVVHRALGALEAVVGRGEQRPGGLLHRHGAAADGLEHGFDAGAERGGLRVDHGAPLLAVAQRVAFLLGDQLPRDIGMRVHPAAAGHRLAVDRDEAPVAGRGHPCRGAAFGDLLQAGFDISVGIAQKRADLDAMGDEVAHRRAGPRMLGPHAVHRDKALVAEDEPRGAVEHAQALRHVVERGLHQPDVRAQADDDERRGERRRRQRQQGADGGAGDRRGKFAQRTDQCVAAEGGEARDAGGKPRGTGENDRAPVACRLPENLPANHVTRPVLSRQT